MSAIARRAAGLQAAPFRRDRPSFTGAVRSELLKIGRQRLTWTMVVGFVLVSLVAPSIFLFGGTARSIEQSHPLTFYFRYLTTVELVFTMAAGAALLVASSRLVAMEYGSGTIRVVLARGTSRLCLLGAQYVALVAVGLLLLAASAVISIAMLYGAVVAWSGGFGPVTSLPSAAWTDTGINVLVSLLSIGVCVLLGTAAAVLGRSVAFGVGVALAFFPADNFGTIVLYLVFRLTHQDFWIQVTQYLLGPVLNQLPRSLQTDHAVGAAFAVPLVQHVDTTHVWLVVGIWSLAFLAGAVALTWRRDVLH